MASGSSVFEWALKPPAGHIDGVLVAFAFTRTHFLRVSLDHPQGSLVLERTEGSRFYGTKEGCPAGARLRVVFEGNAPLLAHVTWIQPEIAEGEFVHAMPLWFAELSESLGPHDGKRPIESFLREKFNDLAVIGEARRAEDVAEYLKASEPNSAELFRNRERAIDWQARAQSFFLRLDIETKYDLVPLRWKETLLRVGRQLAHRIEIRARLGNEPEPQVPEFDAIERDWPLGQLEYADLQAVSVFLCNLITSSLENYGGSALVAWAFEMFATDRLAVQHVDSETHRFLQGHGAANGLVFLQFGEFAFYCIDNDVDAELWERHLDALVRASHAFVETARDPTIVGSGPHSFRAYEFREGRLHRRRRLDELREESRSAQAAAAREGKSPMPFYEDRFTSIAAQAHADYRGPTLAKRRALEKGHEARILPRGALPWP